MINCEQTSIFSFLGNPYWIYVCDINFVELFTIHYLALIIEKMLIGTQFRNVIRRLHI